MRRFPAREARELALTSAAMWKNLANYRDGALLFLRLTLGPLFILVHGWQKLAGGLTKWKMLGGAMKYLGVTLWPGFWGFLSASVETLGMALLILGLCFRPSCLLLVINMTVAAIFEYHLHGLGEASHPIELGLLFLTLLFIGPGKFSFDGG